MSAGVSKEEECRKSLEELIAKKRLSGKTILCFGNNDASRYAVKYLKEQGLKVSRIVDNKAVEGMHLEGIEVCRPEEYQYRPDTIVLIGSRFFYEMKYQLTGLGCREDQIYEIIHYPLIYNPSLTQHTFKMEVKYICKGYQTYKKIRKQLGRKTTLYISPAKSIGDIYLTLAYLGQSMRQQSDRYGFVICTNGAAAVCREAGEKNYIVIKQMNELCRFIQFVGEEKANAHVLNAVPIYANRVRNVSGYGRCRSFDIVFRNFVFDLNMKKPGIPLIPDLTDFHLPEKTVVISPYTNFLEPLGELFWKKLCVGLKNRRWNIFINKTKYEKNISGTTAISYGFSKTLAFVNQAGYFIGVRSGLCDVLSSTTAKMYVLYPEQKLVNDVMAVEYFSLKTMKLNSSVSEIVYRENEMDIIIKGIIADMEVF